MALASSPKTAANANTEDSLERDVSSVLWHVGEPTSYPLHTLLGGDLYIEGKSRPQTVSGKIKKEVSSTFKYDVIEKDPLARTATSNADDNATDTTLVFVSNTNFRTGDLIKNRRTGEMAFVVAVDSGGTDITARRNLGSTTYTIVSGDVWYISGCAFREGTAKASQKAQLAATRTRYTQIFKRTFGVSGTLEESKLVLDIDGWTEEMKQAGREHRLDIENSAWFNPNADSTTDASGTVYLGRGIIEEIGTTRTTYYNGSFDEAELFGRISQEVFEFGPRKKTMFVNAEMMSTLNEMPRVKIQTKPMETQYGFKIQTIEAGHGMYNIVMNGTFDKHFGDDEGPFAVVLDLERTYYKYMSNRDSKFYDMIQTPGDDAREGQFITECGFSLRSLPHHRIIRKAPSA